MAQKKISDQKNKQKKVKRLSAKALANKLELELHSNQIKILKNLDRFNFVTCGRRFGKTVMAAFLCAIYLELEDNKIWIVAPTYDLCGRAWDYLHRWAIKYMPHWNVNTSKRMITNTMNGSFVQLKSADNPVSLIGEGLNLLIVDEAARIPDIVWQESLRPTLSDRRGSLFAISTPKAKNWFFNGYKLGKAQELEYKAWTFQSKDNLAIPHMEEEQAEAKKTMPENVYRQEYEAEFVDDSGSVFRRIRQCVIGELEKPNKKKDYVIGVDLAMHQDFTVIVVIDLMDNHVVHFERFNSLDWELQEQQIAKVSKDYGNAWVYVDATGAGNPIAKSLARRGVPVYEYVYTNASKKYLIENLVFKIENQYITFPDIPVLISELEVFGYDYSPKTRRVIYNAPDGYHDDCVNALALAVYGSGHYERDEKKPEAIVYEPGTIGYVQQQMVNNRKQEYLEHFI